VLNHPQNELVCLSRQKDRRFTTAWIFPQQVEESAKAQGGKLKPAGGTGVKNAGGCQERYLLAIFARICKNLKAWGSLAAILDENFQIFIFFLKFLRIYVTSCFFSKAMPPLAFPIGHS
jgi:hypothetical protein